MRARWVSFNLAPLFVHVFQEIQGRLLHALKIPAFFIEIFQEVHRGLLQPLELRLLLVEILQDIQGRALRLLERRQTFAQSLADSAQGLCSRPPWSRPWPSLSLEILIALA